MRRIVRKFYWNFAQYVNWVRYAVIFKKFQGFTMIPQNLYISNLELSKKHSSIPGDIVECGTWKGGMIAGIAKLLGKNRNYFLFDSFEGLPAAKEIDGASAIEWQQNKNSKYYYNNCTASEQDAQNAMGIAGIKNPSIVKGWFNDSLPKASLNKGIAILRMDADWYDSTLDILKNMFGRVNKGGVIIIDDYYVWDGCSKAVHDFLSANRRTERIRLHHGVCYIIKE